MRIKLTRDPDAFARRAQPWLERLECNVMATVLMNVRERAIPGWFGWAVGDGDTLGVLALHTPPWPLLLTADEPELVAPLLERWLDEDPALPGATGTPSAARAAAGAWAHLTGGRTEIRLREAMHVLEEVLEPRRPADGALRVAAPDERDLLAEWWRAFAVEAGTAGANEAEALVAAAMRRGGVLVWEDAGRPVTLVGVNRPVAGVVRIGPVYTPPGLRRRGYATSAVAAASRRALNGGASRCMLYTDLANPTSNKIYASIGYRRVGDWEEHEFSTAVAPASSPRA